MDVANLIQSMTTGTYVVIRTPHSQNVRGRNTPGPPSTFSVVGVVHPASGNDLLRLPEGRRTNETRAFYSATELLIGGQGADFEADRVAIDNLDWEVQHVERWTDPIGLNLGFKCLVQAVR